jgi:ATP-binding cassette subfamily C protein
MDCAFKAISDLDKELKFKDTEVCLTNDDKIVIKYDGREDRFDLSELKGAYVEDGVGIGKLILVKKGGEEVEAVYFTKRPIDDFRKLAILINGRLSGNGHYEGLSLVREERRKPNVRSTLLWLLNFMRPYWHKMLIGVILSISIAMLNLVPPYLLKILIDNVFLTQTHSMKLFIDLTLTLIGSYVAVTALSIAQNYILNTVGQRVVNDIRSKVFKHAMRLSASFIDRISTGRILSRLTTDAGNTQWLMVWGLPTLIVNLLTLIGIGVILFTMDVRLALFVLLPTPVIAYMVYRYRKKSHRIYHRNWRRSADVTSALSDTIPNYMVIKSFAKEDYESDRLDELLNRLYESQVKVTKMNISYWPFLGLLTSLSTVMMWWFGGEQVIAGTIQLGTLTAFVSYMAQFYGPINNLSNIIPFIQQAVTSGDRLREIMEAEPDVKEPEHPKKPDLKGDILFSNVWFSYDKYTPVLKNINLRIKVGEKVAVVGKSGSGKTTLSKLLLRMYDVDSGEIKINGVNIKDIDLQYLRERVAYVPQEVALFDNTVAYNVAYGSSRRIEPWEIIAACKAARIHDEIMQLPLAYDTNLGERGSSLSGGQRQRISIARAIIKQPDIVILDEATSNLDVINEAEVYRAIMNLAKGRTTIFVTHSFVEVMSADRVIVMANGEIIEEGKPTELIARRGAFYQMFKDQLELFTGELRLLKSEDDKGALTLADYVKDAVLDLSKAKVKVRPGSRRSLVTLMVNGEVYSDLKPKLPFPISQPEYVILYDRDGRERFMISNYRKLDPESVKLLEEAIKLNNFKPMTLSIKGIDVKGDELEWRLVTNYGEVTVRTRGRRNVILMDSRLTLIDVHDNVYEIDLKKLDKDSLKLVAETI